LYEKRKKEEKSCCECSRIFPDFGPNISQKLALHLGIGGDATNYTIVLFKRKAGTILLRKFQENVLLF